MNVLEDYSSGEQIDSLLGQAKAAQKSKQRGKYFENSKEERWETLWKTG